jgi:hypothetical protein
LGTGAERQLTNVNPDFDIRDFDILRYGNDSRESWPFRDLATNPGEETVMPHSCFQRLWWLQRGWQKAP